VTSPELTLDHRFYEGDPAEPVLLLLHGTGGGPDDLRGLAEQLKPRAAVLAPAGPVHELGAARWFRRLAESVFDTDDVIARMNQLADFVIAARQHYGLAERRLVAVGFSNGANIAAALVLGRPDALREAILFAAMMPLPDPPTFNLQSSRVFLSNGDHDPMAPADSTARLVQALRNRSAGITTFRHPGGHEITRAGLDAAMRWLNQTGSE
jgi:phospholipase/carboxylesterase